MTPAELRELLPFLTAAERAEFEAILAQDMAERVWVPLPGPQTMAYESRADVVGYGGSAGGGKGLALDTPLPTLQGWVRMGDVQPGTVLFDQDGAPCNVVAVSEVSHRPCYRLTFDDGSTLTADDVHRWVTFDAAEMWRLTRSDPAWKAARRAKRPSRATGNRSAAFTTALAARNTARAEAAACAPAPTGSMRDTAELHRTLRTPVGRTNHAIPVCKPLQTDGVTLPVPPYTLGAWLGDGTASNGGFTGVDAGIWERIEADGYEVRHYAWNAQAHRIIGLRPSLRALGVLSNKHIPAPYLRAAYADRLALLQGLMDTDGYAALDGQCHFDGMNERLVHDVLELVRSFGIKATITQKMAKLNGRDVGLTYRVAFMTQLPVFGLLRKLQRLKTEIRRTTRFRYLVACELVESVPTRCIAVDSPTRQYLAGEAMVPTHNTDLAIGKALTRHTVVQIFRREGTELGGIIDRMAEVIGHTSGLSRAHPATWRKPCKGVKVIEFGSAPNPGDETKYQGRPKDLLVIDEAANFLEQQVRFLMGWVRTTDTAQRCQTLLCFNPPTAPEGRWIVDFFAPWLDRKHPKPAAPGELRYVAVIDGKDVWVDGPESFVHGTETITPQSRTFVPARVTDNPFLMGTNYMTTLQAMPEPLRSQMLYGDFDAGTEDSEFQVIPTEWVDIAMARWTDLSPKPPMDSIGLDVARGGKDNSVLARRHGWWFDKLIRKPGKETPDGPSCAGLAVAHLRDDAVIHVDVIGVGASPYDALVALNQDAIGVNVAEGSAARDKSGRLGFFNLRSQLYWQLREALDPTANNGIALPPDPQLKADLCAFTWKLKGAAIYVCSREEVVDRIGRSPDDASAVILASMDTPKSAAIRRKYGNPVSRAEYDPLSVADRYAQQSGERRGY